MLSSRTPNLYAVHVIYTWCRLFDFGILVCCKVGRPIDKFSFSIPELPQLQPGATLNLVRKSVDFGMSLRVVESDLVCCEQ